MNVVSFALYGNIPKYTDGAIRNAIDLEKSDWNAIFYCGEDVADEIIQEIQAYGGIVIGQKEGWHTNGMFWRYYAITHPEFDRIIFRDVDSRIRDREWLMINDWVKSSKPFHIIRDHPAHLAPILGGLWGATKSISDFEIPWEKTEYFGNAWGEDQKFLKEYVYPKIRKQAHIHDCFFLYEFRFRSVKFPRESGEYSGESVEQDGSINHDFRLDLFEFEKNSRKRLHLKIASILDLFRTIFHWRLGKAKNSKHKDL